MNDNDFYTLNKECLITKPQEHKNNLQKSSLIHEDAHSIYDQWLQL